MATYILFETALEMLKDAYLASTLGLIAFSGIGLAAIALIESDIPPSETRQHHI
ncbi:hypothetical protein [Gloeocapsopsis dulcis]|uniref:hypothetical protein n=1 Tax=Gloeocapsopsis dulcis TaxID=2859516 RepID=UPI0018C80629|nr:hypothetical protein [Gloeocapsopsis dulcis]WNN87315.1 hypothetical protein P0S91_13300 [Gloeocapsopsis dulcis]